MRKIKFRIWDKEMKKFFEPIYKAYEGELYDLSITCYGEIIRRTLKYPSEHESMFPNRYEISQFTGLKDKNNKEIYEGDICKGRYPASSNPNYQGEVKWNDILSLWELTNAPLYVWENIEIIGNIFEK